jgi:hypothetical protein
MIFTLCANHSGGVGHPALPTAPVGRAGSARRPAAYTPISRFHPTETRIRPAGRGIQSLKGVFKPLWRTT